MDADAKPDFFISFQKADRNWAEWIAWELDELGYDVIFQPWDFLPGENFVLDIHEAVRKAKRTVAVLSPDYLEAFWPQSEWAAAFLTDPTGEKGKLLPIRVRECTLDGLLAAVSYLDLVGLDEESARTVLRLGVRRVRLKPSVRPPFPGAPPRPPAPSFPGPPSGLPDPPDSHLRGQRKRLPPAARVWRGTVLRLDTLRRFPPLWLRPALLSLAVVVVAVTLGWLDLRHRRAEDLTNRMRAAHLPTDLPSAQSQLDSLWLTDSVPSTDWLSPALHRLKLTRRPRPPGNESRPPWTGPTELEPLPRDLLALDISDLHPSSDNRVNQDALMTLTGLPAKLQYLNISQNDRLESLEGLPSSVTSLSALSKGLSKFAQLPSKLECLELGSPTFGSPQVQLLRGLRSLRSLSLRGTGVTSLRGLPGSLVSLELFNDTRLATIDALPPLLRSLSITALSLGSTDLPSLDELPSDLQDLHLSNVELIKPPAEKQYFPALRALTLNLVRVPDWSVLPPSLQSLALVAMPLPPVLPDKLLAFAYQGPPPERVVKLPPLPPTLEVLRLANVHVGDLSRLPRQLTGLAVINSSLTSLAGCPPNLKRLDLRSTTKLERVTYLPANLEALNLLGSGELRELTNLPATLKFLNIAGTGLKSLPRLPPALEALDISDTEISSLRGLPHGLKTLTVSIGKLQNLAGLPDSVRELRFVETRLFEIPGDRAEESHFACELSAPDFERWPCLLTGVPPERH